MNSEAQDQKLGRLKFISVIVDPRALERLESPRSEYTVVSVCQLPASCHRNGVENVQATPARLCVDSSEVSCIFRYHVRAQQRKSEPQGGTGYTQLPQYEMPKTRMNSSFCHTSQKESPRYFLVACVIPLEIYRLLWLPGILPEGQLLQIKSNQIKHASCRG